MCKLCVEIVRVSYNLDVVLVLQQVDVFHHTALVVQALVEPLLDIPSLSTRVVRLLIGIV